MSSFVGVFVSAPVAAIDAVRSAAGSWREVGSEIELLGEPGLLQITNDAMGEPPAELLAALSCEHGDAWWLEFQTSVGCSFVLEHWSKGACVRALTYDDADSGEGWVRIEGEPAAWEHTAPWEGPPEPGGLSIGDAHDLAVHVLQSVRHSAPPTEPTRQPTKKPAKKPAKPTKQPKKKPAKQKRRKAAAKARR